MCLCCVYTDVYSSLFTLNIASVGPSRCEQTEAWVMLAKITSCGLDLFPCKGAFPKIAGRTISCLFCAGVHVSYDTLTNVWSRLAFMVTLCTGCFHLVILKHPPAFTFTLLTRLHSCYSGIVVNQVFLHVIDCFYYLQDKLDRWAGNIYTQVSMYLHHSCQRETIQGHQNCPMDKYLQQWMRWLVCLPKG